MSGVNRVILVGNMGKDPEIKGDGDDRVAIFSVATSDTWTDKRSGEKRETTEWHRVVVFSKNGVEFTERFLRKGMKVYVEGQNMTRKYEKDGVEHYITEVACRPFRSRIESLEKIAGGSKPSEGSYGAKRSDIDTADLSLEGFK